MLWLAHLRLARVLLRPLCLYAGNGEVPMVQLCRQPRHFLPHAIQLATVSLSHPEQLLPELYDTNAHTGQSSCAGSPNSKTQCKVSFSEAMSHLPGLGHGGFVLGSQDPDLLQVWRFGSPLPTESGTVS